MTNRMVAGFLGAVFLLALLPACEDDTSNDVNDIVFPPSNVSYGKSVEPLFLRACALPGCHTADTRAGNLSLESYQDAFDDVGVIIPGDTLNSRLVWRIEGRGGGERMPLLKPPLNANQINGLKRWILEGARNN